MKPSPEVVENARKSVVIVSTNTDANYYCGFIVARARLFRGRTYTVVIAPNEFVLGEKDRFSVCFFDGIRSPASLVAQDKYFCLLSTAVHRDCVEFSPSDVDIICSPTFMLAPTSPTKSISVSTHITLHSLESYAFDDVETKVEDSEKFFLMSCGEYFNSTPNGIDRLSGGLVYNLSGIALGAVVQDCREDKNYKGMKVVAGPVYLNELLERLLAKMPTPKKKGGRKRGGSESPRRKRGPARGRGGTSQ